VNVGTAVAVSLPDPVTLREYVPAGQSLRLTLRERVPCLLAVTGDVTSREFHLFVHQG
jgi:hypothetical protein